MVSYRSAAVFFVITRHIRVAHGGTSGQCNGIGELQEAQIEQFSVVDSYFDAKRWQPSAGELVQAVEERIIGKGEPYIVLPRYVHAQNLKHMVGLHKKLASGTCFKNTRPGLYTVYQADAFSEDIDRFTQDQALHAAASIFLNASSDEYVAVLDIYILIDMSRCKLWRGGTCGRRSACSAGGWHIDRTTRSLKAILYLEDVRGHNGPFSTLHGYPRMVNRFGFDAPDLKMCYDVDDSSGKRVLRYDTNDLIRKMRAKESGMHAIEVHAPAGSVILFDISTVHHGKNVRNSSRMSLTNMYETRKKSLLTQYPGDGVTARCLRSTEGTTALDWPFKKLIDRALGPTPRVAKKLSCQDTSFLVPFSNDC